mmetsp:Transcript_6020/g.16038  ORF Transcript_6020/g.16038 Transcript_6020/m.16038 type:complete len:95 (+) Transcript_6020:2937-3221(+)
MVDRRCATTTVVRPTIILFRASCTMRSLCVSRAEVASSSSSTLGFFRMARAMAIRCFCPPDNCKPRSPTCVMYPSGRLLMNLCALAEVAASWTS